ncbi:MULTISPECIES: nucleotidyltransferase family protein [Falsihalocynthiibacter]|uniref:nucleotidyltransferase family protein n=1 Tax=Falsihalocynthiibacter TaxID=2854182 RepID=UPI0030010150
MTVNREKVDLLLSAAISNPRTEWPHEWRDSDSSIENLTIERALYHGIAGVLIAPQLQLENWPQRILDALLAQSRAQAMWELRHRSIVAHLILELTAQKVTPILLKGTALAYDVYDEPYWRQRGDTDILVRDEDLAQTRETLRNCGFKMAASMTATHDPSSLQEPWEKDLGNGHVHEIDLHWRVMKGWALGDLFTFEEALRQNHHLPRLCKGAMSFGPVLALLHACVHRAQHISSPYYVDGVKYFGGDRLIWLNDIHLLAASLSSDQWDELCDQGEGKSVAEICYVALKTAERLLGTPIPPQVMSRMEASAQIESKPGKYLLRSEPTRQVWYDFVAVPGGRKKIAFIKWRLFPPETFMRAKYPDMAERSLPFLYGRRMLHFFRRREQ